MTFHKPTDERYISRDFLLKIAQLNKEKTSSALKILSALYQVGFQIRDDNQEQVY
jgi:hypothetical protein